ncbi:MAG TPA: tripartite tricarboxylate transporter substrate binding protein [Myxococcaceae bacterium]|nr:tripartite tricarboxylate transporter substrate binding protein [Myxococcaceae bacterium]
MLGLKTWTTGAVVLCVIAAPTVTWADFKPSKTCDLVVHGGPGSGNDLFARALAAMIEQEKLAPVRFNVLNKPGGGSATASAYLAGKPGDAHTLGIFTNVWMTDPLVQEAAKVSIHKDLTPIARMVIEPALVAVRADSPYKTLKDFVQAATAKSAQLKQSGGSITSRDNLIRQMIMKQTGANWSYISFPSGSERLAALLGGHVDLMVVDPSEGIEQIRSGKLRALAQVADKRLAVLKDVPTLSEAGFNIAKTPQIRGVVGPPGLPADAVAYYENLLEKVTRSASWRKYVAENHFEAGFGKSAETRKFLALYENDIREQLKEVGAKVVR